MARTISDLYRKCQLYWPVGLPLISLFQHKQKLRIKTWSAQFQFPWHTNESSTTCHQDPFQCCHVWGRAAERHMAISAVLVSTRRWKLLSFPNQGTTFEHLKNEIHINSISYFTQPALSCTILWATLHLLGHAVAQLVEALRYKPEGRGFDSRMVSLEFFIDIILSAARPWSRLSL